MKDYELIQRNYISYQQSLLREWKLGNENDETGAFALMQLQREKVENIEICQKCGIGYGDIVTLSKLINQDEKLQ